ncbi:beta family protein [Oceanobacillus profundus]|uniref:beta family protein n=1 Tax=Oceanobacillus profundus TaxID=372463 RepID=UPI0037097BBA
MPQSLPVSSEEDYHLSRIEKDLFNKIKTIVPHSNLIFGDYTSVSPVIATGGRAIVQLKYTLEDEYWFVRNGLRRGNYDFVAVCKQIANLETFNERYCWGDSYIKTVVDENTNKGNPSVWTSIGVNRHIVVCLEES